MGVAALVGAATGLAAVFFINLIALIQTEFYTQAGRFLPFIGNFSYVLVPVVGALLAGPLIAYFAAEAKGHGVPEVMQAIVLQGGRIRARVPVVKIIASALCIGTGGSAGREGPIVQAGAAMGSALGQWLGLSEERIKNLVSCGASAGIAATFNAPLAGVAFATEVLMTELHGRLFANVVISAVFASIVSRTFLGARPAFTVPSYTMRSPWDMVLYLVLGLVAALVGVMMIRMLDYFETIFDNWSFPLPLKPAVGALLLGVLGLAYIYLPGVSYYSTKSYELNMPLMENMPHVFGAGFTFIERVLQGHVSFLLIFLLIFLKPLATSFTLGSGNSGGVFAPALFTGAVCGGAFGYIANQLFPGIAGSIGAYALVGMAAVFASAARAPLTAMLIVFEMSNDYSMILPLMVSGIVATAVASALCPESIYTIKLVKRGIHFVQGRDMDIMQGVKVEEVMNDEPIKFNLNQPFTNIYAVFQETNFHGFPIVSEKDELYGIVTLEDMTKAMLQKHKISELAIKDVASKDPITVFPDEPVWAAIQRMSPRDLSRLPVVSRQDGKTLIGLISRSDIIRAYEVGIMRKQKETYASERMALRNVGDVKFIELLVKNGSRAEGKTLAQLHLPQAANVVSVERNGTVLIPHGDTKIYAGDLFTFLCRNKNVDELQNFFT
ncbi:MAG: CBS domain-containing protein [Deltaproteobacteria bacterium]|nr:CBS domain-containing protein [Deltaproteobacteria bacterium]